LATHDPDLLRAVKGRQVSLRAGRIVEGETAAR
jgi:ABC-type ATPase involved in cell division